MLWNLLLSFRIKKGFCVLQDNSQSKCQTRTKEMTSLMLKALGKKYIKDFLVLNNSKVSSILGGN